MRHGYRSALAVAAVLLVPAVASAQDASRAVAGGGISVPGWMGKIDPNEEKAGQKIENSKFAKEGDGFHVTTGPAGVYWNPSQKASGNYTVKATFKEPKYMSLNNHPHPYGIVIGGNDLGTATQSYLYCAAYGSGRFIVRGFGPDPFQLNGRGETHAAVNKAAATGESVTQEIAVTVNGDKVECAINGQTVASYSKSDLVGAGKLKSTDGHVGIRLGHNTEAIVTGFSVSKK